ncbi:NAD(P)-dependent oxidoreductase [Sphingobacterium sp. JB170]|uniref:NAD(P)-dependent oxidoreductase n=1 Tax=Sphingobacterium sp. JB170 TaxID=1434842 RepID=UPI00097EB364|nr:NAD(P)-dependent oxidoreductase [Sphingobacterium sp. JB170]SJN47578.1 Glyoxylate reductase / Glyoxylate reductase / Hydroxypyruvate reductase [Sphingobacterium sp. JB170]
MIFKKLVAIEPLNLTPSAETELETFAENVTTYDNVPTSVEEIIARIGDADAVLLSYTTYLGREALQDCPNVKYIGMCCSLYSAESANVDIHYANSRGIEVTGIRDYGDEGVVEYVVSELVRCLHGFGNRADGTPREPWSGTPREITGLKVGLVGLGKSGGMVADALYFFGAKISYFSRTRKPESEDKGYKYLPLDALLAQSEVVITCLNKNVILLHQDEFQHLGNRKILFNTGLSPAWDPEPFSKWLTGDNRVYCDTLGALGGQEFLNHPNVECMNVSSGRTTQAFDRLSEKVLANIACYVKKQ